MVGAVIITHGKVAEALIEAAVGITGKMEKVIGVSVVSTDSTEGIRTVVADAIKAADSGKGVVVFTDMFGGTPTNIALSFMGGGAVEVITGVNLPMIIKFVGHRGDKGLLEIATILRDYGHKSIVLAGEMLREKK